MRFANVLSIDAPENRRWLLALAAVLMVAIALVDWWTDPYISLGFLYLFPIMIAGGFLSRTKIVTLAFLCALLQEEFSNLPPSELLPRLVLSSAGFIGTGLFISELLRNRRIVLPHLQEVEDQIQRRREAEEQLRCWWRAVPPQSSPWTRRHVFLIANEAAHDLLAPGWAAAFGSETWEAYLPALVTAVQSKRPKGFRTCAPVLAVSAGMAKSFSPAYGSRPNLRFSGNRLAAIVVDLSEDPRNREALSLDYLLKNTRILMSAVSHEVRNLCGAALVVHKNLTRVMAFRGMPISRRSVP